MCDFVSCSAVTRDLLRSLHSQITVKFTLDPTHRYDRRQTADWVMKHLNVECTSVHVVYLLHRDETTSSRNQPLQRDATYQRGKLGVHTEASFMKSCQKSFLKMPELRDCYCKVSTGWTFSRASCTFMVHYLIHASQSLDWFFRVDSFKP